MATEQQIPKLAAGFVEHQREFAPLSVEDAQWAILNMKDAIALACTAIRNRAKTAAKKIVSLIHLKPVTSDGRNGHQFIEVMEFNRFDLGKWAKNCMTVGRDAQGNLVVTSDSGQVYKPVVIKGEEFEDDERITSNIRKVVAGMKCLTPPWWLAPLLREAMSDEEIEALGLDWLIVMHEPITDSDGRLSLLGLSRYDAGRELFAYYGYPTPRWFRRRGFVFLAPQG